MLRSAYLLAKIGADTAESEQHFAEILPKTGNSTLRVAVGPRRPAPGLEDAQARVRLPGPRRA